MGKFDRLKIQKNCLTFLGIVFSSVNLFCQPTISSFAPASGPVGTIVTITGTNFSTTSSNNIVFFGAVRASVSAATTTSLTVIVPVGATYQPITVSVNNLTAYSSKPFIITFSGATPEFTSQSFEYAGRIDSVDSNIETTKYANGDIDNDGKIDVVTIDRLTNTTSVYRNTTNGGVISFASKVDFITGQSPRSVSIGDIDGDGKLDVVVSNFNDNTVSIFRNTSTSGNILFAPKVDFGTGTQPAAISITDLDNDGKPDLVVNTVNLNGYVSVLRNTSNAGTISFASKIEIQTAGGSIEEIRTADIDGDGKADIVLPNYSLNAITIFRNTSTGGNLSFGSPVNISSFQNPDNVEIGDLDGDGKQDLVVSHYSNINVIVLRNISSAGNIVFQYVDAHYGGNLVNGLAINDLDGDGKLDIAADINLEVVNLFKNRSSSGNILFDYLGVSVPALYTSHVITADFDNDGKPDLAFNAGTARVSIWKNRTTSPQIFSFSPASGTTADTITIQGANFSDITSVSFGGVPASSFIVVSGTTITAVVDTGASGDIVVKTANDSARISGFVFTGPPVITSFGPTFGGNGDTIRINGARFTGSTSVSFGGTQARSFSIVSSDIIKAVVDSGSSGSISVTNSYGTGAIAGFSYYPPPVISSFSPASGGVGTSVTVTGKNFDSATVVTFGELPAASFVVNSSTSITAIVADGATGRIRVKTPGGTAVSSNSFSFPPPTITSFTPTSGPAGSTVTINGTNFISNAASNIVFFGAVSAKVIAATTTTLTVIVPFGVTYQPISVTTNSYTVYGKMPFTLTFQDWNAGITSSSFNWKGAFSADSDPRNDYIFDLDGDGKPDVITRNDVTGSISVLRNISSNNKMSFASYFDILGLYGSSCRIKIGDLNSDGKPDIVVVNGSNRMTVLKNTSTIGNISFQKIDFDTDVSFWYVELQDFDGDGKVDIVVPADINSTGGIVIFPNMGIEGDIAFGPDVIINNDKLYPVDIQVADIDSDGKPDIVVEINDSIAVAVLRNVSSIGNFAFESPKHFYASGILTSNVHFCIADFDSDGKPDLALTGGDYYSGIDSCYILKNTTSTNIISFASAVNFSLGEPVIQVIGGQLDGDGKPDIVITGEEHQIFLSKNTSSAGNVSFASPMAYTTQVIYNWTDCSAIGDLDGDGKPDIAVANGADQKVSVFRNQIGEQIDSVCANSNTSIISTVTGASYQWQLNTGNGFNNISDNINYNGTAAPNLQVIRPLLSWNEYQYRCLVDGNYSSITNLVVNPVDTPTVTSNGNTMTITNPNPASTYTWQMQSTPGTWNDIVPTSNGITYTAAANGTYRVKALLGDCEEYSNEQTLVITAINPVTSSNAQLLLVYPNPARDYLIVEHPSSIKSAVIRWIDFSGRVVKTNLIGRNRDKTEIDTKNLFPGIYEVVWTDGRKSLINTVVIFK